MWGSRLRYLFYNINNTVWQVLTHTVEILVTYEWIAIVIVILIYGTSEIQNDDSWVNYLISIQRQMTKTFIVGLANGRGIAFEPKQSITFVIFKNNFRIANYNSVFSKNRYVSVLLRDINRINRNTIWTSIYVDSSWMTESSSNPACILLHHINPCQRTYNENNQEHKLQMKNTTLQCTFNILSDVFLYDTLL